MLLGIILVALPFPVGLGWMEGGFAISALGVFVLILGVIALLLYLRLARAVENLLKKENVLAHWSFTPEEWQSYFGNDPPDPAEDWKGLFALVSVVAVILGLAFWLLTRTSPWIVVLIVLALILISFFTARVYASPSRRPARPKASDVIVSLDGVSINRHLHLWNGIGTRLEKANLEERAGQRLGLAFEYSAPSSSGRDFYVARIPVPAGEQAAAAGILSRISARHLAGRSAGEQSGGPAA
jgi:hypothetical protein